MAGLSLFFIAVGAVLRFAVSDQIEGVDLAAVGVILMIAGGLGLLLAVLRTRSSLESRSERVVSADGRHVVEESRTDM